MKKRIILSFVFLLIFALAFSNIEAEIQMSNEYIIDDSDVYIDNDKAFIMAPAEIHGSGWTYLNFTAKQYTGNIDLALGFDTTQLKPKKAEIYNPHVVYHSQTNKHINRVEYRII